MARGLNMCVHRYGGDQQNNNNERSVH